MAPNAKAPFGTLHYVEETAYKADKALVAAKFNGIDLKTAKLAASKSADVLGKSPAGKAPFLETDLGCIFSSNAIARFIARTRADTDLYGKCFDDEANIDTWLEFCTHELEVPLMTWLYPTLGLMEDNPGATQAAKDDVKRALEQLDKCLATSAYLVGDFLSLADIVLVCALRDGFQSLFDPAFRKPFPKVTAWFERCCGLSQFKAVFSLGALCSQAAKPVPVKEEFAPPQRQAAAKDAAAALKKEAGKSAAAAPKAAASKEPVQRTASAGGAASEAEIKAVGDEVRVLKERLKGEGLSGKKINDHEEVKALVTKLNDLKAQAPAGGAALPSAALAPPAKAPAAPAGGDVDAKIMAVGDEIRALKDKLKAEGLSGKKINDHEEIKALVVTLNELKTHLPAGGAASPRAAALAAAAPAAAAATVASALAPAGSVEDQVNQVGLEIRALKEKLKEEGLSGKQINNHAEVINLVGKLKELKAQL